MAQDEVKTPAKPKAKTEGRPWVVYAFDGHSLTRVAAVKARGAEQAKAAAFDQGDADSVVLMAVPERYVKLSRYSRATKPVVKVEHVSEDDARVGGIAPPSPER